MKVQKTESHLQKKRLESGLVALRANTIAAEDANQKASANRKKLKQVGALSVLRSWKRWADGKSELQEKRKLISRKHKANVLKSALHEWEWQVAETTAITAEAEVCLLSFRA